MARPKDEEIADLPFLHAPDTSTSPGRILRNAVLSLAVHAALGAGLLSLPETIRPIQAPVIVADLSKAVKLAAPRYTDLTQNESNRGKPSRSLDVYSAVSAAAPPVRPLPPAPAPGPLTAPAAVPAASPVPVIELPQVEVAGAGLPSGGGASPLGVSPPPPAKPKLAFESVAAASVRSPSSTPAVALPKGSVQESARASKSPAAGGAVMVGDDLGDLPDLGSLGQVPMPGRMGSNLQLLSDPTGVDFKPYLIQVLTAVRHNWLTVVPESARLGRRGLVLLQFIIDRRGRVPKLVIASPSGTAAFDRAAVVGVSMSHPFPPLPSSYKGDEIRLQLAFAYNVSR
jgi:TonB family protein